MRIPQHARYQTTPPSLLDRMRDHDDAKSWQSFFDVYSPLLYDFCRKRGLQANDAADVVQETLIRVAKGIRKLDYEPQRGRFRDWLYRIVYNEICRASGRKKNTEEILMETPLAFEADQQWNEHFYESLLRTALERIRPKFEEDTWDAFSLVWLQQKPANEVAGLMNRSLDFVYLSKSRVMKRLRLEVEQLADDAGINHGKLS